MAIDHTTIVVPEDKFRECLALYVKALEPLGYRVVYEFGDNVVGLGSEFDTVENYKVADFWLFGAKEAIKAHVAFRTESKYSLLHPWSLFELLKMFNRSLCGRCIPQGGDPKRRTR